MDSELGAPPNGEPRTTLCQMPERAVRNRRNINSVASDSLPEDSSETSRVQSRLFTITGEANIESAARNAQALFAAVLVSFLDIGVSGARSAFRLRVMNVQGND